MKLIHLYSLSILLICTSCEKVIQVNINDADKKYVIEGVVTDKTGSCSVLVSQTKNFDDDNSFVGVSDANVQITEANGATTQLIETSTGVYNAPTLTGASGKTYLLSVNINGTVFTASSTMPQAVGIDSIYTTNDNLQGDDRKLVNVAFTDPIATGNNYRFIQYVNGVKEKQVFVRNDELINGNNVTSVLRYPRSDDDDKNKNDIQSGDQIQVDLLCIDAAVYTYWYSLSRSATGEGNSATPANPVSNINGGALGYFSAQTVRTKTMIVP